MKINHKLDEILNQKSKVKILRFLFNERDEYTGRAIAKAIGMSASSTYTALQEIKDAGIVAVRRKGNAILYKLREENYFVRKLLTPLFAKEKSTYADIVALIKKNLLKDKKEVVSILIFGSVANMEETSKSDIDILIIVRNSTAKRRIAGYAESLSIKAGKKFGVAISPYILTKTEILQKHSKGASIIKSILQHNRLIYGEPIERVLA